MKKEFYNILGYQLDDTQINAITSNSNATLVVAGAGAGKTLTILGKIKYLIERDNINESDILCISFTNEAVQSLEKKIEELGYNIQVRTFHRLSLDILEEYNYQICDDTYLDYIIDEYFKSFIYYDKKKYDKFRRILNYNKRNYNVFSLPDYEHLKKTIKTFIALAKTNCLDFGYLIKIYKWSVGQRRLLLKWIMQIQQIYKNDLLACGKIDFDDMIILATKNIVHYKAHFKYIIVDEFQDTSLVRLNLIKAIMLQFKAKLFVVGDDWQSIYRFSGCDLKIFLNFQDYFSDSAIYYLKYTYRNSNQLIKISSNFVMKNKLQMKKSIISPKNNTRPIKILFGFSINESLNLIGHDKNILILARTNYELKNIDFPNKLTIHKSKGLEEDIILLINSDNIPSIKRNDDIINIVLKEKDYVTSEEERRLFYVALTRAKEYVYIIVNKNISPFVKEIIKENRDLVEIITKKKST